MGSGTSAKTSCLATPLPQSITYAVLFVMMTCAEADLAFRGLGPPPVPRRTSRVFVLAPSRAGSSGALATTIVYARDVRRLRCSISGTPSGSHCMAMENLAVSLTGFLVERVKVKLFWIYLSISAVAVRLINRGTRKWKNGREG